jgi:hypothetical protein
MSFAMRSILNVANVRDICGYRVALGEFPMMRLEHVRGRELRLIAGRMGLSGQFRPEYCHINTALPFWATRALLLVLSRVYTPYDSV